MLFNGKYVFYKDFTALPRSRIHVVVTIRKGSVCYVKSELAYLHYTDVEGLKQGEYAIFRFMGGEPLRKIDRLYPLDTQEVLESYALCRDEGQHVMRAPLAFFNDDELV